MKKTSLIFLLFLTFTALADTLSGKVVRVVDGDTVYVLDANKTQHKIRLTGIDAPERKQAFGKKSKEYLSGLVAGRHVVIDYSKRDRYKRILGKVLLNNVDMNLEIVKAGLAWHYKKYQKEQAELDRELYSQAETEARENKRGLWFDVNSIPPWEFRKQ